MTTTRSVLALLAVSGLVVSVPLASPAMAATVTATPASSAEADGHVGNSVQIGSKLYIGGTFATVDGAARSRLAALDAGTGELDPNFSVDVTGEVTSLATDGVRLYIAGNFTSVGGATRKNVASIDTTGKVLPFKVTPSAVVESIDYLGGVLYLGGKFSNLNGTARPYLGAVDGSSGALVVGFNPAPNGAVFAVKSAGGSIWAGGSFTTIGGMTRSHVAKLAPAGTVASWKPGVKVPPVFDIALSATGADVYLAVGGGLPTGNSSYALNAGTGAKEWQVITDGNNQSVEVVGSDVYVGGHFNNVMTCSGSSASTCTASMVRKKALAVSADGTVLPWAPKFNSALGVWDLTAAGGNLYALGDFTQVDGKPQAHIARFPLG